MAQLSPIDIAKFSVAQRASLMVEHKMKVGLGSGGMSAWLVQCLGERMRDGLDFVVVPTSERVTELARSQGLPLATLEDAQWLDLTIDGADEFDGQFNFLKGRGSSFLRDKVMAMASDQMVVIADKSQQVDALGQVALPVEVLPYGADVTRQLVEETLVGLDVMGREVKLRMNDTAPYISDMGNFILDLDLKRIGNPREMALVLNQIPGVVENGLFVDICDTIIVGGGDGLVRVFDFERGALDEVQMDTTSAENLFGEIDESGEHDEL